MLAFHHLQFGTVPDWVTAISTSLAFLVASVVLYLSINERRKAQASEVAAWLEREVVAVKLVVANSSDLPVYEIIVIPQFLGRTYETIFIPLMEPKEKWSVRNIPVPGTSHVSNEFLGVEIEFNDSAGRRWKRDRNGKLHRRVPRSGLFVEWS